MSRSFQRIVFGAPGTGKSFAVKRKTAGKVVIRTTFHPDSDYSTFVGAYKPTTKTIQRTTVIGTKIASVDDGRGNQVFEEKIVYEFVPQAFLLAYVTAWKKFCCTEEGKTPEEVVLVIEEINRGNCAQIFGDLFQLLDRGNQGFSEYPIRADSDMKRYLDRSFKDVKFGNAQASIGEYLQPGVSMSEILSGDVLVLPSNLSILATMNTSDQSLFPIDSAFKRRWDWEYVPICDAEKNWTIHVGNADYSWWSFLEKINERIYQATHSEDKKIGYFFCKPDGAQIDAETFVSKVIFYLWNDVFKDFEFDGDAFKDEENGKLTFDKFYFSDANGSKIALDKVELFLKNLGLVPNIVQTVLPNAKDNKESKPEVNVVSHKALYQVNGKNPVKRGRIPFEAVKEYAQLHPQMTAAEISKKWNALRVLDIGNRLVETKAMYDKRKAASGDIRFEQRSVKLTLSNKEILYISNQVRELNLHDLMKKLEENGFGIHITKAS